MDTVRQLELVFKTADGKKRTLRVGCPPDEIDKDAVKDAMDAVVDAGVFAVGDDGELTEAVEARVRTTQTEVVA